MNIAKQCREQRNIADKIFMDFKYTKPGSQEQLNALQAFHLLIGSWADSCIRSDKKTSLGEIAFEHSI